MNAPWWAAFGSVDTSVSCGSSTHKVRWSDGQLHAVAHADAEGELVLAALGGESNPCLDLIRTWGDHSDDLSVLALGPRSAADTLSFSPRALENVEAARAGGGQRGWIGGVSMSSRRLVSPRASGGGFAATRARPHGPSHPSPAPRRPRMGVPMRHLLGRHDGADEPRVNLIWLLTLGPPFQFRLSGTVAHAWSADGKHAGTRDRARPALTAALTGRLAPAAAGWLGIDPGQVEARLHDGPGWGAMDLAGPALAAHLPASWLARVWAPGLAVVDGHFVVDVQHADYPAAEVLALPGPATEPVGLSVRHTGRGWSRAR